MTEIENIEEVVKKDRKQLYNKRFYGKHKDIISQRKYIRNHGTLRRTCGWCGADISHIKPRHRKFCSPMHGRMYEKQRKHEWWVKNKKNKRSK